MKKNRFAIVVSVCAIFLMGVMFVYKATSKDEGKPDSKMEVEKAITIDGKDIFTQNEDKYLVYFYQDDCHFCQEFTPTLKKYLKQKDHLPVYKVNLQEKSQLKYWTKYKIDGTPTILVIQSIDGKKHEANRLVGMQTLEQLNAIQ
ncbi:thioredoxin family protein [Neobacillus sp. YIM B02564]|uniref:Thioredoxin family protein n=1 Tax=Neobacillus paridis TaxID=2803862 RepID=A0ABS1TLK8_9BACI|nr:thioredoxin family protein [Neobacillus paridis]MBL4952193.1 thioredoxin family protein [Neobacillus paridis]